MKTLLASGLAFAVLTGVALAQAATPAPAGAKAPPPPATMGTTADPAGMAPPPPPPPGGPRAGGPGMNGPMAGGPGPMGDRGPDGRRLPPPPPPRGAHIHLQRGDLVLDVKCADDEPTKACGDTALQMLDRVQAMPQGATQGTPPAQ